MDRSMLGFYPWLKPDENAPTKAQDVAITLVTKAVEGPTDKLSNAHAFTRERVSCLDSQCANL